MADSESVPKLESDLSSVDVLAYLRRHPDFLIEHPEILSFLAAPPQYQANGIVDFQSFMLDRLRGDVGRLQTQHNDLIASARANLSSQSRIHTAVIAMLGATTLEHLIEIVTTDLALHLEVDAIILAFEALDRVPGEANRTALKLLPKGTIDRAMAGGRDIVLIADEPGDPLIFGGAATLVRSQALLRLQLRREAPLGMLAFGARTADKFHAGQGTELLSFLGRVVELSLRGWLDRA
ncbi:MAG TPA: DUF484 family protein [Alphaproteobacteria bacterium]|nr:DUF484 family protein [Alphaproteobacteria bacterium]